MRAVRGTPAALVIACALVLGIAGHAGAAPPDESGGVDDAGPPSRSALDDFDDFDDFDSDETDTDRDDGPVRGTVTDAVGDTDGNAGAAPASAPGGGAAQRGIDLDKPVSASELRYVTDFLVFQASMKDFQHVRRQRLLSNQVTWQTTACDTAMRDSAVTGFRQACERREFGYRNLARQDRFDGGTRDRVDRRFKRELRSECAGKDVLARSVCERQADVYFAAVGTV